MLELASTLQVKRSIDPAATTATATGATVDTVGYEAAVCIVVPGTVTDGTHTPKLQDSPDGTNWTDVPGANLLGSFAAIASNTPQKVGYVGAQRYLRAVITVSGSPSTGAVEGAYLVLGRGRKQP